MIPISFLVTANIIKGPNFILVTDLVIDEKNSVCLYLATTAI